MENIIIIDKFVTIAGLLAGFSLTVVAMLFSENPNESKCKKVLRSISEILLLLATVFLVTACISGSILLGLEAYRTEPAMEAPVDKTLWALGIGFVLFYLGTVLLSFHKSIIVGLLVLLLSGISVYWIMRVYFWLPTQLPIETALKLVGVV